METNRFYRGNEECLSLFDGGDYNIAPNKYHCGDIFQVIEFLKINKPLDRISIIDGEVRNGTIDELLRFLVDNKDKRPKQIFFYIKNAVDDAKYHIMLDGTYDFSDNSMVGKAK